MSKSFRYVKEFEFGTPGKSYVSGYYRGGSVKEDMAQDKKTAATAVHKHERHMHPGEPLTKMKAGGKVPQKVPDAPVSGLSSMRNVPTAPKVMRSKAVPVAPREPLVKAAGGKVGKVMHEFGEGKLHSGSKEGPVVRNPKQAVAIALSEARAAKKR